MNKNMFKVGEIYQVKEEFYDECSNAEDLWKDSGSSKYYIKITKINDESSFSYDVLDDKKQKIGNCSGCFEQKYLINSNNSIPMDLKEKFVLAITPEPAKSFRKAGITDGDNLLTDDGAKIFLTWLLKQNQDGFKTEVVDDLLKEKK